jgi:hypothetical protein
MNGSPESPRPGESGESGESTLPFPTRCTCIRRLYAVFKTRWGRWHASVFPTGRHRHHVQKKSLLTLHVSPELEKGVKAQRRVVTAPCRTEKPPAVRDLVHGMGIVIESLETHGGMGRIYTLTDPRKILKIADIRRSWCAFEPSNYALLKRLGIPCAKVYASATRQGYMICVLERLDFTLTAYIRAVTKTAKNAKWIIGCVNNILDMLKQKNVVYCDLSPDNIMFRSLGNGDFTVALIDPQFVVPLDSFRHVMPLKKADSFDTTYVALKIQTLGMMDPSVHTFTETLCAGILGHVPLEKHATRWLQHEAPVGLFMAYDILKSRARREDSSGPHQPINLQLP